MYKVAIIELTSHFEVARAYAKMILSAGHRAAIFTTEANYVQLKNVFFSGDKITWHIMQKEEKYTAYLEQQINNLDTSDIVLCCTGEIKDGTVISKIWKPLTCLVIHDANNYFDFKRNIDWNGGLKQLLRIARYFLIQYFSKRQKALKTFDKIIVPSPYIKQYLEKFESSLPIEVLPFLYNEYEVQPNQSDSCTVVIPGTVNQRSRDYFMVCSVLKKMFASGYNAKIKLVLLGVCKSKVALEIKSELQSISPGMLSIQAFDKEIDQTTYDAIIQKADFFLLPLQSKWQYGIVNEIGGITCLSGNIGDMVRYGMPALLPEHYKVQDELLALVTYYDSDVEKAAHSWNDYIVNKEYNKIKNKSKGILEEYNENIKGEFKRILGDVKTG
jgi:hypothetical protein